MASSRTQSDRSVIRYSHVLMALVGGLVATAAAAARTTPPTLTAQRMFDDGSLSVTAACDPQGTSVIDYTASGTMPRNANDNPVPYPGTFTETGHIVIGPQTNAADGTGYPTGTVLEWTINFSIQSGDTTVTGTKKLARRNAQVGVCRDLADGPYYSVVTHNTLLEYSAVIQTPDGSFKDGGTAFAGLTWFRNSDGENKTAWEELYSKQRTTRPAK